MKPKPEGAPILKTADAVMRALRNRYAKPDGAWALLECVANGTGSRADRWADAVAMSVWPSRGLEIHGFEIKISRNDLLREIKDPRKAEAVAGYCDYWWIAVGDAAIAKASELPSAWGLLVPKSIKDGATMVVAKEAKQLAPKDLDRGFLAAILRRASERFNVGQIERGIRDDLYAQLHRELTARYDENHQRELQTLQTKINALQKSLDDTKAQLATSVSAGFDPSMIGEAMELLLTIDRWPGAESLIRSAIRDLNQGIGQVNVLREKLQHAERLTQILTGKRQPEALEEIGPATCPSLPSVAG